MANKVQIQKQALEEIKYLNTNESDSVSELRKKRLRGELTVLKNTLEGEIFEKTNTSIFKWLEKNTYKIVTVSSFLFALIGLAKPVYDYLVSTNKYSEAKFNGEMISLIKTLSETTGSARERSLDVLTTFDPQAVIPFLLSDILQRPLEDERNKNGEIPIESVKHAILKSWTNIDDNSGVIAFFNTMLGVPGLKENVSEKIYKTFYPAVNMLSDLADENQSARVIIIVNTIHDLQLYKLKSDYSALLTEILIKTVSNGELSQGTKKFIISKILSCREKK